MTSSAKMMTIYDIDLTVLSTLDQANENTDMF